MPHQQTNQPLQQQQPLVTFIVAYYNLPVAMLRQCLDSIFALRLDKSEREVILVDDGSDVSPLDGLHSYQDELVYVRQLNGGLSHARNRGLLMATGCYVQFVDADDCLLQAPYEHCLDLARNCRADVVMFDMTDETTAPAQDGGFETSDLKSGTEYLAHHNLHASACGYLFRRAILGELRFTPGIYHEDEEFTPQLLLRAYTVCSTDAQAYYYRQRPHSITTETSARTVIRRLDNSLQVINKLNLLADTLPTDERLALQRRVAQLTMDYIYNIIMQTRNRHYLDRKLGGLRRLGLFPLPDRNYTTKYRWFRRLTNSSVGLSLLMNVLPMINKER